jgi:hypothetical protein
MQSFEGEAWKARAMTIDCFFTDEKVILNDVCQPIDHIDIKLTRSNQSAAWFIS